MKSVILFGALEDVEQAVTICFRQGCFHPEDTAVITGNDRHFARFAESNPYQGILSRMTAMAIRVGHELQRVEGSAQISLEAVEEMLVKLEHEIEFDEQLALDLQSRIAFCENALDRLEHMGSLEIDLEELFASRFLHLRFGRFTQSNYRKLSFYEHKPFIFAVLDSDGAYAWGLCLSVNEPHALDETDAILSTLSFERLWVSGDLQGTPQEAIQALERELSNLRSRQEVVQQRIAPGSPSYGQGLDDIYSQVLSLYETFELRRYMVVSNDDFLAVGFIPSDMAGSFAEAFACLPRVSVEIGDAASLNNISPPTKLQNHPFIAPMEFFVRLYGLPKYEDPDPTPFLAVSYLLLFGIMFGDVGQGLAISLVGWLMIRRGMASLGAVLTRLGIFSTAFGFLYGSVFGFENALDFIYKGVLGLPEKPLEVLNPGSINQILLVAISLGALLLLTAMIMHTVTSLLRHKYAEAFLHKNGLPGLVFYAGVLLAATSLLLGGPTLHTNSLYIMVCFVLPLLVLFLREPLHHRLLKAHEHPTKTAAHFSPVEGFFELFEVLMGFASNTISFLRVGGFVLSHAGMMTVVMILANLTGGLWGILVVIIGNIFVLTLEGMICGIQVLRLQFYEIFSHFFDGGGRPFQPVGLKR